MLDASGGRGQFDFIKRKGNNEFVKEFARPIE